MIEFVFLHPVQVFHEYSLDSGMFHELETSAQGPQIGVRMEHRQFQRAVIEADVMAIAVHFWSWLGT